MMSPRIALLKARRLIPYKGRNTRNSNTGTRNRISTHTRLAKPMKRKALNITPIAILFWHVLNIKKINDTKQNMTDMTFQSAIIEILIAERKTNEHDTIRERMRRSALRLLSSAIR